MKVAESALDSANLYYLVDFKSWETDRILIFAKAKKSKNFNFGCFAWNYF